MIPTRHMLAAALMLAATSEAAVAQTTPDSTTAVLERFVTALGGRQRMLAIRTTDREQLIVTPEGRRTERWVRDIARGRAYERIDAPTGVRELGFDGTRGWVRSIEASAVVPNDADDIRELRQPERGPEHYRELSLRYTRQADRMSGDTNFAVLRGANGVEFDFDQRTGLLANVRRGAATVTYGQYKNVDGWKIPFETDQRDPEGLSRVTVLRAAMDRALADSLFTFDSSTSTPPTAAPGARLTDAQRSRSFDIAWGKVRETMWDSSSAAGPWRALRDSYRRQAMSEPAPAAFHAVLREMLTKTHQSHYDIIEPDSADPTAAGDTASGDIGLGLLDARLLSGSMIVTTVLPGSPAARAGLRPGDAIARVDSTAVKELIARFVHHAPALGPEEGNVLAAVWAATVGGRGTPVRVVYERNGAVHSATIVRGERHERLVKLGDQPPSRVDIAWRELPGGIGYLRFTWFMTELAPVVDSAFDSMRDTRGLVIDLRGNAGGEVELARTIMGRLITHPETLAVSHTHVGDIVDVVPPSATPYTKRVVLLVDHLCASSCEELAAGLQAAGRATVVGERTSGALLAADIVPLPSGGQLMYAFAEPRTKRGTLIEGRGVSPDVVVRWSRAALAAGRDDQLAAAIKLAGAAPGK